MQLQRMSLTSMLAAISAITYSTGISFVPSPAIPVWNFKWFAKAASFGRNMIVFPEK